MQSMDPPDNAGGVSTIQEMVNMLAGARSYKRMAVESAVMGASPHELIKLMLDAAIDKLSAAARHAENGNIQARATVVSAAIDIIGGLQESLDLEKGRDLAERLSQLYDYMQRRLFRASVDNDAAGFTEVAELLREIRSGWVALSESGR